MDISEGSVARSNLDGVLKAGIRATDLVRQILTFSRKTEMEYMQVQIKLIVKEAMKLLRPSLPSTIEIRENFSTSREILADPTQIHQVVMNLCTNAYHAMSEDGGVLEIALLKENLDAESAAEFEDLIPGPYIKLTISDTGHGMDEEVMDQIFDPYFTTKEKGRGTGLGLSVVHGIVKSHGGAITVSSAPGKGTTFHVLFPILEKAEIKKEELATGPLPGGNERVLFVDDETPLVKLGKAMLGWLGYDVTVSTGSLEALELFKAKPEAFDLVISDMTMPKMTGDKLAMKIMEIRPEIPVILCTGYSEKINEEKGREMGIAAYAPKPIIMNEIAKTIREVLDKK
jgi:CheY-like chemotaxis protein